MRKILPLPAFILFTLFSCRPQQKNTFPAPEALTANDTTQILRIAFDGSVGSDTAWRGSMGMAQLFILKEYADSSLNYMEMEFIMKQRMAAQDSTICIAGIEDITLDLRADPNNERFNADAPEHVARMFEDVDTIYRLLVRKLYNTASAHAFDVKTVKSNFDYTITSTKDLNANHGTPYPSFIVKFSDMVFDRSHTRACMYVQVHCGMLCASAGFYFFQKNGGRWFTAGSRPMWAS